MKLYAIVKSKRDSRIAKKGDNDELLIDLSYKNDSLGQISVVEVKNGCVVRYIKGSVDKIICSLLK